MNRDNLTAPLIISENLTVPIIHTEIVSYTYVNLKFMITRATFCMAKDIDTEQKLDVFRFGQIVFNFYKAGIYY